MTQQLVLGTAQFGLDYGITNTHGALGAEEAREVLRCAWEGGVRMLDTAHAYGRSEEALGAAMGNDWQVVTKTLPLRCERVTALEIGRLESAFTQSLQRLGSNSVDTLLVHHAQDLLVPGGERVDDWLQGVKRQGRASRVGASVYSGDEISALLDRYAIDAVQLPASIADQRLVEDGSVARLHEAGVQVHVRSLFLQGLLLAGPAFVAQRFPRQAEWAQRFAAECAQRGVTQQQACLGFFKAQAGFDCAVVGITRLGELEALLDAWRTAPAGSWEGWSVDNTAFTDPRLWPPRA